MTKKQAPAAPFAETVAHKARARGWRGKPWPEGKPLPIDDIFAWLHIRRALGELLADPVVTSNPAAVEFVQIVGDLAERGALSETAKEALLPVGADFADNAGRGEGPVKKLVRAVLPRLEKRLGRKATALEVWHACAARRGSGIKFHASPVWGTPLKASPSNGEPASWAASWARFRVIVSEVRKGPAT